MKLHAKTITISLTPELSNAIFNYLETQEQSENKSLQQLLQNGVEIENGTYHDKQLGMIEEQLKALNRNHSASNQRLKLIENQLGDIDDFLIQDDDDFTPLINPEK